MSIPEEKPKYSYFDYMKSDGFVNYGLGSYDRHWENGRENQPSKGSWVIPSSEDFMKIFPSTPHAGNITFRTGGNNSTPMYWGVTNQVNVMGDIYKVLRVTVPYYEAGMSDSDEPADRSDNYRKAWLTLHKNEDAGTTAAQYTNGSPESSKQYEPDGDPEDGYASVYIISRDGEDNIESLPSELNNDNRFVIKSWGTIYAVKRVYTSAAYRMRWRVVCAGVYGKTKTPGLYIEICRYRCNSGTRLTVDNYMTYDWEHPAARLYFPICGLGDFTGNYINFGTECQYSTSDAIKDGKMSSAVQIKITGDNDLNAYMAIVKDKINRNFGKQIRLVGGVTDR